MTTRDIELGERTYKRPSDGRTVRLFPDIGGPYKSYDPHDKLVGVRPENPTLLNVEFSESTDRMGR